MWFTLTPAERAHLHEQLRGVADDPRALDMRRFIQHGCVTTYEHCLRVTTLAYWLNLRLHCHARERSLLRGAFLHDFYLYDWHRCRNITRWHGFKHPPLQRRRGVPPQRGGTEHHPKPHVAADAALGAPLPRGRARLHRRQTRRFVGDCRPPRPGVSRRAAKILSSALQTLRCSACRETRHAAKGATAAHGNCLTRLFPPLESLSTKFYSKPRTRRLTLLAHNLPQNFPVCVAAVGACPPAATILNFFDSPYAANPAALFCAPIKIY